MENELIKNKQRAGWANTALHAYSQAVEEERVREDLYDSTGTVAIDLFCDLCHLAHQNCYDPLCLIETALTHFRCERVPAEDEEFEDIF